MPRRRRNQGINLKGLRKKCSDTGRVGQVEHIHIEIPPSNRAFNPKETKKVVDIKGAVVKYYSSTEGAEAVHGEGSFTNNYTEADFYPS